MTLEEIAHALVKGCREDRTEENIDVLYAPDALSVEPFAPEGQDRITRGREGIHGKHQWWSENAEVHDASLDGPFIGGDDTFAVVFNLDVTMFGERSKMNEVALYTVKDGQIVREEFLYGKT